MKMTLLDMVQDILNDLDSDEVNSIDDTVESQQIAQIIKTSYFEIIGNRNWPHLRKLIQVEAINDVDKPNYLKIPENMKEMVFLRYNVVKDDSSKIEFRDICFREPDDFLKIISGRNSENENVRTVVDFSGSQLLVLTDVAPSMWTTFDDVHIVTDSYNSQIDDTLKKSKTQCLAYINPTWTRTNEAVPDLPVEAFPALLSEAKSTAFVALKQMVNQKAEQKTSRQQRWLARKAWSLEGGVKFPNYGRKGRR